MLDIARAQEYEEVYVSRLGGNIPGHLSRSRTAATNSAATALSHMPEAGQSRKPEDGRLRLKDWWPGVQEVVLTGIHLSSYGTEHMEGSPVKGGDWDSGSLLGFDRADSTGWRD